MRRLVIASALAGLVAGNPVQAEQCLDRQTLAAARVQEFGAMMMAVSLRCRAIGVDIAPGYEAMLGAHQRAFAAADRHLRTFHAGQGHAFDRYTTQLGNRYGGGATDPANCRRFEHVASDLAAKPDAASLGRVALAMVAQPRLGGRVCPLP